MRENRTSGFLEGRALKGVRLLDLLIRDIAAYVTEYGLSHLTTGDIMKMAFDAGYIDESQGNTIWANMIARKRKFGYRKFFFQLQQCLIQEHTETSRS